MGVFQMLLSVHLQSLLKQLFKTVTADFNLRILRSKLMNWSLFARKNELKAWL